MRIAISLIAERITDAITDACLPNRHAHVCVDACACAWLSWRPRIRADPCEPFLSVGADRVWFGSQAFSSAAFNPNIGAWNTASVTTLFCVCAAFSARRRATAGTRSAGVRCGAAVVRGGTADAPACVCVLTHVQALASAGVHLGRVCV